MNKKSIGALLLSAALLVGASGSTFAYFTANAASAPQKITLGDVKIEFKDHNARSSKWLVVDRAAANIREALLTDPWSLNDLVDNGYDELVRDANHPKDTIANVAPGDVLFKSFILQNTGSLDAKVRIKLENITLTDKDGKVLSDNEKAAWFNNNSPLFKAYTIDGDNNKKNEITLIADADYPGQFILDAKSHEKIAIFAYVLLGDSMNNNAMDKSINFDVKAEATQWNNPGWSEVPQHH